MIYLYVGFFLFILYMAAPLKLFLWVAALSLIAMRFSYMFKRDLKDNPVGVRMKALLALDPKRRGGLNKPRFRREKRRFERVAASLEVTYEILPKDEEVTPPPYPEHPGADPLVPLAKHYPSGKAIAQDISEGGLAIQSDEPFTVGEQLRLFVQLLHISKPVAILAEVRSCRAFFKKGSNHYKAGLMILDLDLEDLSHLLDFLFLQRQ